MNRGLALTGAVVTLSNIRVLERVDLAVEPGELVALVGPNGAGKTTAARALAGLVELNEGRASIGGVNPRDMRPDERARQLAYLPQARPLAWDLAVEDVVALGRFAYGAAPGRLAPDDAAACARALAITGLEALAHRPMRTLSGGEQARAHIARALATETPALIADEPAVALDPRHQEQVMAALADRARSGSAVLAVMHDLALAARWCDRVVVMQAGRVVADGTPREALSADCIAAVYGVSASWVKLAGGEQLVLHGAADEVSPV